MVNIKKLLLIVVLTFIPAEARDLLRIAIDLPEGLYLFKDFIKDKHLTDRALAVYNQPLDLNSNPLER